MNLTFSFIYFLMLIKMMFSIMVLFFFFLDGNSNFNWYEIRWFHPTSHRFAMDNIKWGKYPNLSIKEISLLFLSKKMNMLLTKIDMEYVIGTQMAKSNLQIDLTINHCLEWSIIFFNDWKSLVKASYVCISPMKNRGK